MSAEHEVSAPCCTVAVWSVCTLQEKEATVACFFLLCDERVAGAETCPSIVRKYPILSKLFQSFKPAAEIWKTSSTLSCSTARHGGSESKKLSLFLDLASLIQSDGADCSRVFSSVKKCSICVSSCNRSITLLQQQQQQMQWFLVYRAGGNHSWILSYHYNQLLVGLFLQIYFLYIQFSQKCMSCIINH